MRKLGAVGAIAVATVVVAACGQSRRSEGPAAQPTAVTTGEEARPPQQTPATTGASVAVAKLQFRQGIVGNGVATFSQQGDEVKVVVELHGATPGKHGVHLHANGDCGSPDFASAGEHFNPAGKQHGGPHSAEHHAGDFGNIEIDANGNGHIELTTKDLTVSPGPNSVVGKALVVHESADDEKSQPAGNSGGRIACGVVEPQLAT